MPEISDKEILSLFRNSETRDNGFNLLVDKYKRQVYWNIRRIVVDHEDANDIVQNVFVKVFRNLGKFREDSGLYTWMYRVTINEALSFLKNKRKRLFLPISDHEHKLAESLHDDNFFTGNEIQMKLQQAILTLPAKQRLVFNMKYFEELSYDEMSKILGTSVGALKASYHIAVKKIEQFIKKN